MDLAWSEAVEDQAWSRVHRYGQQRDVFIDRLVIQGTIEERILALQEKKRTLADGSLGDRAGNTSGRFSVQDMANRMLIPSILHNTLTFGSAQC